METESLLIAIDPGQECGIAVLHRDGTVSIDTVPDWRLEAILDRWSPPQVLVEDFKVYPQSAKGLIMQKLPAAEAIGIIKAWCWRHNVPLIRRMASTRGSKLPLAKELARQVGGDRHAVDALAHLLQYIQVTPQLRKEAGHES